MPPAALAREASGAQGEERPPALPCGGLGRYRHVKGPRLRRYAAAGRTNPLTCLTLEKLATELLRRQKSKAKAAQKGRK